MSTTVSKHQNLIGGEWVDAAGGETMEVLNPATGETIAEVPRASAEDVDRAVQAAKKALVEWRETTPADITAMVAWLDEHGGRRPGFDVVMEGETPADDPDAAAATVRKWADAGCTWWLEARWQLPSEGPERGQAIRERLEAGPPR